MLTSSCNMLDSWRAFTRPSCRHGPSLRPLPFTSLSDAVNTRRQVLPGDLLPPSTAFQPSEVAGKPRAISPGAPLPFPSSPVVPATILPCSWLARPSSRLRAANTASPAAVRVPAACWRISTASSSREASDAVSVAAEKARGKVSGHCSCCGYASSIVHNKNDYRQKVDRRQARRCRMWHEQDDKIMS